MEAFIQQLAEFMQKQDHPCPLKNRPPKKGVLVHTIPVAQRALWVLAASLKRAGFEEQGEQLLSILARQTIARIEAGVLFAMHPTYVFCFDWGVYRVPEGDTQKARKPVRATKKV